MKQFIIVFLLLFVSLNTNAQILFEKGYYIDNNNQRVECLIKNMDWRSNPSQFKYKKFENSKEKKATSEEVKEFGVYSISKYISRRVKIDRSSNKITELSSKIAPIFKEEKLFLRAVLEGKVSLYLYQDHDLIRFFYKKDDTPIKQLVYKLYENRTGRGYQRVSQNNTFRSQIFEVLKCPDIKIDVINDLKYNQKELILIFTTYNDHHGSKSIFPKKKQKKDLFHLSIKPRINYNLFDVIKDNRSIDFTPTTDFAIGIEFEYILPFYKNKWTLIADPNYQQLNNHQEVGANVLDTFYAVMDYNALEIPLGVRHYFFLNKKSKIFIDALFMFNIDFNSSLGFQTNERPVNKSYFPTTGYNFGAGIGYNYNNQYSTEIRYHTNRDLFGNYRSWRSDYTYFSFILGYSFFRKESK
jgi:hypothetical protein